MWARSNGSTGDKHQLAELRLRQGAQLWVNRAQKGKEMSPRELDDSCTKSTSRQWAAGAAPGALWTRRLRGNLLAASRSAGPPNSPAMGKAEGDGGCSDGDHRPIPPARPTRLVNQWLATTPGASERAADTVVLEHCTSTPNFNGTTGARGGALCRCLQWRPNGADNAVSKTLLDRYKP